MKLLHYSKTFIAKSETFIARYVQNSARWSDTMVMAPILKNNYSSFNGLEKISRYQLKPLLYKKKTIKGALQYAFEKITDQKLHYKNIHDFVLKENPDVVHCHFGIQGVNFNKAVQLYNLKVPFAVSFYGYDASIRPLVDEHYRSQLSPLFENCGAILVEGPVFKKKMISLGAPPDKIHINPLLIPVNEYPQKMKWYTPGDVCTFLCAGRFVEKKGFHLFLEAIGQLRNKLPEFEITIIGEGPYKEKYDKIIGKYHLERCVRFLEWVDHAKLLSYLKECDFFVHPSVTSQKGDSEGGAPTILLEGQAIKTPIITSSHADIPNVMGYNDFICKEGDIDDLKSVIKSAFSGRDLKKLVNKGRKKVIESHNIYSDIYKKNIMTLL